MIRILLPLCAAVMLAACQQASPPPAAGDNAVAPPQKTDESALAEPADADANTLFLFTKDGKVTIRLRPDLAPNHVKRIKTLVKRGFYNGLVFHRVIAGFMAQTGDPTGTGRGGSDLPDLKAEFSSEPFVRGTLGMARATSPDSANSQFFIMFAPASSLNGQYTVFGQVTDGMDVVDKIKKGDEAANGKVENPDRIIKMVMKADAG